MNEVLYHMAMEEINIDPLAVCVQQNKNAWRPVIHGLIGYVFPATSHPELSQRADIAGQLRDGAITYREIAILLRENARAQLARISQLADEKKHELEMKIDRAHTPSSFRTIIRKISRLHANSNVMYVQFGK